MIYEHVFAMYMCLTETAAIVYKNERMNDRQLYVNFKTVDHLHIRDVAVASK